MHSAPGEYRGFFWFYFINEHLLRFLNLRYPRDYNTVPRLWFWLLNLVWIFPWSVYLLGHSKVVIQSDSPGRKNTIDGAVLGRRSDVVLHLLNHPGVLLDADLPCFGAPGWIGHQCRRSKGAHGHGRPSCDFFAAVCRAHGLACYWSGVCLRSGNISTALTQHPELYTLSMGHIRDLTLNAFAYLRLPLAIAAFAFGVSAVGIARSKGERQESRSCYRCRHGPLLSGRPNCAYPIRLVSGVLSAGSKPGAESSRTTDRSQFLLRFFIRFLLYRSHGTAAQRPQQQPRVWLLRPGGSPRIH